MKPKKVDSKRYEKLSSPKLKMAKEKALARWGDGLFYIVNIVQNTDSKKKCVVQFEDKSLSTVQLKDVLREKKKDGDSRCHVCGVYESCKKNLVECVDCEREYHIKCHKPAIIVSDEVDFVCRICVFAACAQPGGAKKVGDLADDFKQMKTVLPYDERYLTWDASHLTNVEQCYCYCGGPGDWYNKMLQCCRCRQWFHEACIHCLDEELMVGDRFYIFACAGCNQTEFVHRMDMTWYDIATVALFHLTMTYTSRYVDLEDHLIPFIKAHLQTFGLTNLLLDGRHGQGVIIRQELEKVLSKQSVFCNGWEVKKKLSWYGLRERIPSTPPPVTLPVVDQLSEGSLSELTNHKTTVFSPVKFMTPVPYIFKNGTGSKHLSVPPRLKAKLKPNKLEILDKIKTEPTSPPVKEENLTPDFSSPPSPSPNIEELDKNNNSPRKGDPPHKSLEVDIKPTIDTSIQSKELPKPNKPVLDWDTNWTLDLAIPQPDDFQAENHPFLTEFEQQSLRRQKAHFMTELQRLSYLSSPPSPLLSTFDYGIPATVPVLDTSSPVVQQFKGFNGELVKLLKQQDSTSPALLTENKTPDVKSSPVRNRRKNGFHKSSSPEPVVNDLKVLKTITPRNGLKEIEPDIKKNSTRKSSAVETMQIKALNRCLKNLSPTCGFHFPVLTNETPGVTVSPVHTDPIVLDDEEPATKTAQSKSRKRGQKRRHSCVAKSSPSVRGAAATESETQQESVRRSHRSRKNVKRFEATIDGSFDGLAKAMALSAADTGQDSHYDVLSLRSLPDGRVDYLIRWSH